MRATLFLALATTLLLAGCSGSPAVRGTLVTRNDFEAVLGWAANADGSITNERAHSGKYCLMVGPEQEFGYTYAQTLGRMSAGKPRTLTVSAWAWVPSDQAESKLVVDIRRSAQANAPVYYGSVKLAEQTGKAGAWRQISHTFTLPDSVQETNLLKCYLWHVGNADKAFVDDLTLSVED